MSFEPAAVEVVRRKPDEGSDLFAAHLAELGQQRDEGEGKGRAYAPHRGQQVISPREIGIAGDDLGHTFVEQKDVGLEPRRRQLCDTERVAVEMRGGAPTSCTRTDRATRRIGALVAFAENNAEGQLRIAAFCSDYRSSAGAKATIYRSTSDMSVATSSTCVLRRRSW